MAPILGHLGHSLSTTVWCPVGMAPGVSSFKVSIVFLMSEATKNPNCLIDVDSRSRGDEACHVVVIFPQSMRRAESPAGVGPMVKPLKRPASILQGLLVRGGRTQDKLGAVVWPWLWPC